MKLKSRSKQSSLLRYFPLNRYPRLNRAFDWVGLAAIGIRAFAGFCALMLGPLYFVKSFPDAPLSQLYSLLLEIPKPLGGVTYASFQLLIILVLTELGGRIVQFRLWGHERPDESGQPNYTNKPDIK
jgi:hypothetical protein